MKFLYFSIIFFFYISLHAQVGINNTDPKAILDITAENAGAPSITDGILIPRLDVLPATDPTADQNGMLIFLTTTSGGFQPGFLYWDATSTNWVALNSGSNTTESWKLEGNAIEDSDFFGTTNNKPIKIYTNNSYRFSFTPEGQLIFKDGIIIGEGSTVTNGNIAIGTARFFWGPIKTEGDNSIAIGTSSQATKNNAMALGARAMASGVNGVGIGPLSIAGTKASAFGPESEASADYSTAIGSNSKASNESSVAIGYKSIASAKHALAFGREAKASGGSALAFGQTAEANGFAATAVGSSSKANGESAIAIGYSEASGEKSIAIGGQGSIGPGLSGKATASSKNSTAIGTGSKASQTDATAIGRGSLSSGLSAISLGTQAKVYDQYGIAIGSSSEAHLNSIGIGRLANAYGDYSISLGDDTGATLNAIAIGNKANAFGDNSIAIGNGAKAEDNSVALGDSVNAYQANTIIIGNTQKVGIGTNEPQEKLQVNGKLRYVDGTEGDNKVLTSDANGTASWKSLSGFPQIIAAGLIQANGTALKITGATVTYIDTGDYQVTFSTARASAEYIINLATTDYGAGNDDPGITYYDRQTSGFKVNIGDSDGSTKNDIDLEFSFSVIDF
ncbi:hypothetical protein [Xanthomarina gelatinilytica]|uniref:hypothetical protein n=1 Tax=Xanthomarina gelatinilytica TaxID=1137281 RepID=UPI003AA89D9C